jgi:hypothetical protein
MSGDEVARIERAMDRQADKIGASIFHLGEKIDIVGNRVTRCETQIEDMVIRPETTGVGPAPTEPGLNIPWRIVITIAGCLAAGGGGWEAIRALF